MCSQNESRFIFHKERILHVSRRMIFWKIQGIEVVPLSLDERTFGKSKTHTGKYRIGLADQRRDGMNVASGFIRHSASIP